MNNKQWAMLSDELINTGWIYLNYLNVMKSIIYFNQSYRQLLMRTLMKEQLE